MVFPAIIFILLTAACSTVTRPFDPPDLTVSTYRLADGVIPTQMGAAGEYLGELRGSVDDKVQLEVVGDINNPWSGALNLYRYHSAYSGTRYCVFVVRGGAVRLQLYTPDGSLDLDTCSSRIHKRLKKLRREAF